MYGTSSGQMVNRWAWQRPVRPRRQPWELPQKRRSTLPPTRLWDKILVGNNGMTLYIFTKDTARYEQLQREVHHELASSADPGQPGIGTWCGRFA